MRKFLLPIINLVNLILVSIAWGLSNQSAITDKAGVGRATMYDIVWMGSKPNVLAIVAFFLFCVACLFTLIAFLPVKIRKFVACLGGLMYVGSGVLYLIAHESPKYFDRSIVEPELTGAYIAFCVLILVAGGLSLLMSVIDFMGKKEAK